MQAYKNGSLAILLNDNGHGCDAYLLIGCEYC